MLISYDSKSDSINTLIDSFTKLPEVTNEVSGAINELFNEEINLDEWVGDFECLAELLGTTDENFVKFLETSQQQGIVFNNVDDAMVSYQTQLKNTGKGLDLATIKTKALSASMKILSSIGWMLAITAITEAIQILVTTHQNIEGAMFTF